MNQLLYFNDIQEMQFYAKRNQLSLFVYKKAIYDLTDFITQHPGGQMEIQQFENQDVSNILFQKSIHKHKPYIIATLQNYLIGYIEKRNEPVIRLKSSQLIIEKTRKVLRESTLPQQQYEDIPEDCSIEEMPILQTNKKLFHSQKSIQIQK
ncbi:unnamed protein product (macronuclear) [Paramecium tetraurelia]|uniref:Cytochrome b5 heme-binding domain-containing protein n=1 Tax=Paramecium tetraurelia TaxID=5888 RepID=A0DCY8_PARTE|nr:uncharacterized protein GSPATT00015764001 [Paramecium tetraurelia]CAK80905.1 unnamed protein product [Paramecium tetraurelia]|eukprot:XP_001448302.1 hypothetical protein (macronuclear) [Paramecium tetraurelia strain d4-2]